MNYQEFSGKIKTKYPQYKDIDDRELAQRIVKKYPQYSDVTFDEQSKGLMSKGWDALKKPEEMSRSGLQQLAQFVPEGKITGNKMADVARGTPRIAANTLAEAAPGFLSRGSLVSMGALQGLKGVASIPKVQELASELAGQLEGSAGSPNGTLAHGFKSAKNFFGAGRKAASPIYESARPLTEHPELSNVLKSTEYIDKARQLAEEDNLSPFESLKARQGLDSLKGKKGFIQDKLIELRKTFDPIAKSDARIAEGDKVFQEGMKNEALRGILPRNKYGTISKWGTGIMTMFPPAAAALSPVVQGAGSTALGAATRMNPAILSLLSRLIQQVQQGKSQGPQSQQQ